MGEKKSQNDGCPQTCKLVAQLEQEVQELLEECFQGESRFQPTDNVYERDDLCSPSMKKGEAIFKTLGKTKSGITQS